MYVIRNVRIPPQQHVPQLNHKRALNWSDTSGNLQLFALSYSSSCYHNLRSITASARPSTEQNNITVSGVFLAPCACGISPKSSRQPFVISGPAGSSSSSSAAVDFSLVFNREKFSPSPPGGNK